MGPAVGEGQRVGWGRGLGSREPLKGVEGVIGEGPLGPPMEGEGLWGQLGGGSTGGRGPGWRDPPARVEKPAPFVGGELRVPTTL